MPIGQPATYPLLSDIMLLARSYVLDTTPSTGQVFTDTAPFTLPFINAAIRELYRKMGNSGVGTLIQDNIILLGLTPVNGPQGLGIVDPAVQVNVSYAGYFDGSTTNASLKIPQQVLSVMRMWERTTGTNTDFVPMRKAQFGLASRNQTNILGDWEYRQDGIYMVGALQSTDIRFRATIQLTANVTGSDFSSISVPILDCTDALAYTLAYKFRAARAQGGDAELSGEYKQNAQDAIDELILRQVRSQQALDYHRMPYGEDSNQDGVDLWR